MPHLYNTALLHIWVIAAGPRGYRLCGAGDRFIKAAEAGKKFPAVVTAGIALVLFIWAQPSLYRRQLADLPRLRAGASAGDDAALGGAGVMPCSCKRAINACAAALR